MLALQFANFFFANVSNPRFRDFLIQFSPTFLLLVKSPSAALAMKEPQYANYPLTHFDGMCQGAGVVTGWLVEGFLDLQKVDNALSRLVMKWPMLAGRLERTGVCRPIILLERPPTHLAEHTEKARSQSQSSPGTTSTHTRLVFAHLEGFR